MLSCDPLCTRGKTWNAFSSSLNHSSMQSAVERNLDWRSCLLDSTLFLQILLQNVPKTNVAVVTGLSQCWYRTLVLAAASTSYLVLQREQDGHVDLCKKASTRSAGPKQRTDNNKREDQSCTQLRRPWQATSSYTWSGRSGSTTPRSASPNTV